MLYEKSKQKELSQELFEHPSSEYRGAPFWAWNCKLDKVELVRQVEQFKKMGLGGFHIHCRVGLDTEYLGTEFFECAKACEKKAEEEDLLCYLYDEDRWPSGSAGGIVTKEKEYRTRFLVFQPADYQQKEENAYMAAAKAVRSHDRTSLGFYKIYLDEEGYLTAFEPVDFKKQKEDIVSGKESESIWEAYVEISGDTPWFNNEAYVDTMNPKAIEKFIEVTHEKYLEEMGEQFGKNIKSIFTDEPQLTHKGMFVTPFDREPVIIPFTDDFEQTFEQKYGYSILAVLPELFWEQKSHENYQVRYHYQVHVMERFSQAFGDQIGSWCENHKIALTGHMMNEWTLYSQTLAVGECMRPMKHFGIPGVDMLCDRREFSTVKQAQSVSRQQGREGVMSEIYGVTGWAFDFRNHKLAGDWQAALGVTLRVPHLTWVSMEGEAKRDYPASIGYQSPWYEQYQAVENHFARLNTAMTRGKAIARVGVIHPIESYWMCWGNKKQTALERQAMEEEFTQIIEWLLFNLIDFDFISESLLEEEKGEIGDSGFPVGVMHYETVVVPDCKTLRSSTVSRLAAFQQAGGKVIFLGKPAEYVDAIPSNIVKVLAEKSEALPFNQTALLEALEPYRDVDVDVSAIDGEDPTRMKHKEGGSRSRNLFYQMRQDGQDRWLYLCHVNKAVNEHIAFTERWTIRVKGFYTPVCYDTMNGEIYPVKAEYRNGDTFISNHSSLQGSLLLKLIPGRQGLETEEVEKKQGQPQILPQPQAYYLEEENSLLLDQAEYAFDDGEWQPQEEILRIDNLFRERLGFPQRMEALAQPWTQKEEEHLTHVLKLRVKVESQIETEPWQKADPVFLAMEHPTKVRIFWNGAELSPEVQGWYVDPCLQKVRLPILKKGTNELEVHIPFGQKTNVEWMYLLGAFGVRVRGRKAEIVDLPKQLFYGDITRQDLAFYGGNLWYETEMETEAGHLVLEVSHYRGALMRVELDGEDKGTLFLAPYRMDLGVVKAGTHQIRIRLFGNRINTFGAMHNADASEHWYGPNLWRTQGNKWAYEYQLCEMGILTAPVYWIEK